MRFDEDLHQQFVYSVFPEGDLLISVAWASAHFHAVQSALSGQRRIQFLPTRQNAEDRIVPQLLVVVEVFVAESESIDSLRQHLGNGVLDQMWIPAVEKAFGEAW